MKRATGAAASSRATPRRSLERGAHDVDARVGVVDPVDRHLVDAQAAPLGEHEQLGVEEPAVVADVAAAGRRARRARTALKPHCASEKRARSVGVQERGCSRARSARAWGRGRRARRARAACRSRRRCGRRAAARRAAAGRAGRSRGRRPCRRRRGVARRPRRAQRAAAALALEAQDGDARQLRRERAGDRRRRVGARVVGDRRCASVNGNSVAQEGVQAPDAGLERAPASLYTGTTMSISGRAAGMPGASAPAVRAPCELPERRLRGGARTRRAAGRPRRRPRCAGRVRDGSRTRAPWGRSR